MQSVQSQIERLTCSCFVGLLLFVFAIVQASFERKYLNCEHVDLAVDVLEPLHRHRSRAKQFCVEVHPPLPELAFLIS